jgi:hypothetical protein
MQTWRDLFVVKLDERLVHTGGITWREIAHGLKVVFPDPSSENLKDLFKRLFDCLP